MRQAQDAVTIGAFNTGVTLCNARYCFNTLDSHTTDPAQTATGRVFIDENRNGLLDEGGLDC